MGYPMSDMGYGLPERGSDTGYPRSDMTYDLDG